MGSNRNVRREWIKQLWYNQIMEYYLALKRNELLSHEKMWGMLNCVLLSERSELEKAMHGVIPTR